MFSIRLATAADIQIIRDLASGIWPQTYTPIIGAEQVSYMLGLFYAPEALQQQMDSGHEFVLVYFGAQSVGFASWSEVEPGVYKLHKLYVLPAEQRLGVGRHTLSYIVAELKGRGASSLRLNVNRWNARAIAFYGKNGFANLYDEDIDIGNGFFMNDHVLSLDLTVNK